MNRCSTSPAASMRAGTDRGRSAGSLEACREHALEFELLTAAQLHARHPGYELPPGMTALFQPQGGLLVPERCVMSHVDRALRAGATVMENERVSEWEVSSNGVRVRTANSVYAAARLRDHRRSVGPQARPLVVRRCGSRTPGRHVVAGRGRIDIQPRSLSCFQSAGVTRRLGHYYGFPVHRRPGSR